MLQHKPPTICTSIFPTGHLKCSYYQYFERLIPHSVRLTGVTVIPNFNCWLFAGKSTSFPLPHSFGIDQAVLSRLLAERFSSGASCSSSWQMLEAHSSPGGPSWGLSEAASSVSDIAHQICEVLCRDRGPNRLPVSKKEMLWVYTGPSSLGA